MIKEYFSFTKKERIAIFTLIGLILGIYFLPQFITPDHKELTAQELEEFRKVERELAHLQSADRSKNPNNNNYSTQRGNGMDHAPPFTSEESKPARLFYFDPNTLDADGWKQLGLRDKTIGTIHNYIAKGGRFKQPADLKKIYGLRPDEFQRLEGYVRIEPKASGNGSTIENRDDVSNNRNDVSNNNESNLNKTYSAPPHQNNISFNNFKSASYKAPKQPRIIEINTADSTALIELPGIGSKLASRILNFRDKLGGFYNIDQVKETYGLPDSTFQKIQPWLTANASQVRKININIATLDELRQHPYIRWNLATALIKYREQHGAFNSLQQLQQIGAWNVEVYNKILPYLKLE